MHQFLYHDKALYEDIVIVSLIIFAHDMLSLSVIWYFVDLNILVFVVFVTLSYYSSIIFWLGIKCMFISLYTLLYDSVIVSYIIWVSCILLRYQMLCWYHACLLYFLCFLKLYFVFFYFPSIVICMLLFFAERPIFNSNRYWL